MDEFIAIPGAFDVPDGQMQAFSIQGHDILVAHVGDAYLVTDERCPHLGGHLAKGQLEGAIVTCHLHHSQFDLSNGKVVRWTDFTGAVLTVAELARHPRPLRTYDVRVEQGVVYMGAQREVAQG